MAAALPATIQAIKSAGSRPTIASSCTTSMWHAETVAGEGSTFSAPSMTVNGNSVNIAAMGPSHRLRFTGVQWRLWLERQRLPCLRGC